MKTSTKGLQAIEGREGRKNVAYQDSKGIWTIGVGHTGPEVVEGLEWTEEQIEAALAEDVTKVEDMLNANVTVDLKQNQFDALVSIGFNIGYNGELHSTILRKLNAGDYDGASDAIMMWDKPPEIVDRRKTEQLQFDTPYTDA